MDFNKKFQGRKIIPRKKWEGVVKKIGDESFEATLFEIPFNGLPEELEIPSQLVSSDDQELFRIGSSFYLHSAYCVEPNGKRIGTVQVYFKRTLPWTQEELIKNEERARSLFTLFSPE